MFMQAHPLTSWKEPQSYKEVKLHMCENPRPADTMRMSSAVTPREPTLEWPVLLLHLRSE